MKFFHPLLALGAFSVNYAFARTVDHSTTVNIAPGAITGAKCPHTETISFLSIPYAQPPVNNLRFAAPQPFTGSFLNGAYNATTAAPACIQFASSAGLQGPQSENCLYLDVWMPPNATSSSNLPVKVWLHGGGDNSGSISQAVYDGCDVATDSIFVSINFRVGVLGFLAVENAGITGNFAIQDILLGLQWVHQNVGAFGGDSSRVLLFGQSAGAGLAWVISTLPQAKSLFSAVLAESGAGRPTPTPSQYQPFGANYAKALGCAISDIACFRTKTTDELIKAAPHINGSGFVTSARFQPFIDGIIVPADPISVNPIVPVVAGSNSDDGKLFALSQFGSPHKMTSADYQTFLEENFYEQAPMVASHYPLSEYSSKRHPAFQAISEVLTDSFYKCPAYKVVNAASNAGNPAYTYLFSHTPSCAWEAGITPPLVPVLGATHTSEIPFALGHVDRLPRPSGNCSFGLEEVKLSQLIAASWTSMADIGKPSQDDNAWPRFNASSSLGMILSKSPAAGYVNYTLCGFWDQIATTQMNRSSSSGSKSPLSAKVAHSAGYHASSRSLLLLFTLFMIVLASISTT